MTCKECEHYKVRKKYRKDVVVNMTRDCEEWCEDFNAKIAALPCLVGDTIYYPYMGQVRELVVTEIDLLPGTILFVTDLETFGIDKFGKTVFLTMEAAEKALKEKENG